MSFVFFWDHFWGVNATTLWCNFNKKTPTARLATSYMDVSENNGTPKSSILIGFSINSPSILGYPYFRKHPYQYIGLFVWSKVTFQGFCKLCRNDHSAIGIVALPYLRRLHPELQSLWIEGITLGSYTKKKHIKKSGQITSFSGWKKKHIKNWISILFQVVKIKTNGWKPPPRWSRFHSKKTNLEFLFRKFDGDEFPHLFFSAHCAVHIFLNKFSMKSPIHPTPIVTVVKFV